jgi:RNA polymerase sigma-70 factor, ECF subfamily
MLDSMDSRMLASLWRGGNADAAQQLFDRYVDRLVALARRRLSPALASRVDPEDIVQSVFRTFFLRLRDGRFHIEEQDGLCKLLMRITVNKTLRQVAFQKAAKRDPGQEAGQELAVPERLYELLDREPTPDEAVAFLDHLEHFLARLRPDHRRILELRLLGYNNEEIAKELNSYSRKIRRVLERVQELANEEGIALEKATP